jgi:tetratricopeptide (TPR) repeat protein
MNLIFLLPSMKRMGLYCLKGQYPNALVSLRKALKTCQRYLKSNDPEIGSLHEEIGDVYLGSRDFISALSYYHRAAEIYYYSFTQQDDHNKEIQHVIKCCNYQLK